MVLTKEISAFKAGMENKELAKYFKGPSYTNLLNTEGVKITNTTFEPRSRSNWHIHHSKSGEGCVIVCVHGRGYYQEEGKKAKLLTEGDIQFIKNGVKHWVGATKDSFFQHLTVEVPSEEIKTEWGEAVSDEEYDKLEGKTLVVYYSMGGNTERIAERISNAKGFDVVRLNPVEKYNTHFSVSLVQRVKMEVTDGYRPALEDLGVDLKEYSRIIIGTPTWWYTMASPVLSFLSLPDVNNKIIVPFQTHGGWPGHALDDIKRVLRNSSCQVEDLFKIEYDGDDPRIQKTSDKEIDEWINSL
ncbi:MAG: hypothetical protein K6G38_03755 [Gammaproteobacteria bacterium]|nr:hypothetical protein [Gammaproteobacteria bacterium]